MRIAFRKFMWSIITISSGMILSVISFSTQAQVINYTPDQVLYDMTYGRFINCAVIPQNTTYRIEVNKKFLPEMYGSLEFPRNMKALKKKVYEIFQSGKCIRDESEYTYITDLSDKEILQNVKNGVYGNCRIRTIDGEAHLFIDDQERVKYFTPYDDIQIARYYRIAISKNLCRKGSSEEENAYRNLVKGIYQNCMIFYDKNMAKLYVDGHLREAQPDDRLSKLKRKSLELVSDRTCLPFNNFFPEDYKIDYYDKYVMGIEIRNRISSNKYENCLFASNEFGSDFTLYINQKEKGKYSWFDPGFLIYLWSLDADGICTKR